MALISNHLTNIEILRELGERVRSRRLEMNVTLEAVAEHTGMNPKTVLKIEAGGDVRITSLIKVLRAFGLLDALDAALPEARPDSPAITDRGQVRKRARPHLG